MSITQRAFCLLSLILLLPQSSIIAAEKSAASNSKNSATTRPNILIVLCDDLGYGDLACYGHKRIQSPNIDRFAKEGLKLTSCYSAAPNCSPARTGFLTGRTPYRVGVHNWIPHGSPMHVKKSEITIATLLRNAGYATAQTGKWHINGQFNKPTQPQPNDHGFDHWFATQNNALPTHHNPNNFVRNGKEVGLIEGYASHIVTDEAINWLEKSWDKEKPFFLYVTYHEPHEPINSAPQYKDLYEAPEGSTLPNHHGNITQMDAAFGRLMKQIDDMKLRDNTFVFFTSDNGPAITRRHPHGSAGSLRLKKGHLYDGGIRVPGIVRYPGKTKPGTVCDVPVSGVDLLPTLCALTKIKVPQNRTLDGANFLPALCGKKIERTKPLYWQYNFSRTAPKVAIRDGDWKLLATYKNDRFKQKSDVTTEDQKMIHSTELETFELYHVTRDIGETRNLLAPKEHLSLEIGLRRDRMIQQLRAMHKEVIQESPTWPAWKSPGIEGAIIRAYYKKQREKKKAAK